MFTTQMATSTPRKWHSSPSFGTPSEHELFKKPRLPSFPPCATHRPEQKKQITKTKKKRSAAAALRELLQAIAEVELVAQRLDAQGLR